MMTTTMMMMMIMMIEYWRVTVTDVELKEICSK